MLISPEIKDLLEALSYIATILGIPAAIVVFICQKKKERRAQELEAHYHANQLYIDYLKHCLDNPDLDAFELRQDDKEVVDSGLPYKQLILFTILISMMETAFLRYRNVHSTAQQTQWMGWHTYMLEWAKRSDFNKAWDILGPQFDTDFIKEMDKIVIAERNKYSVTTNPIKEVHKD